MHGNSNILTSPSHATMTTAVHRLSSTTVYVHGGQQQPRFVSLTTHEPIRKAMQHPQDQPPSPFGAASAAGQHAAASSSRAAGPSQPPMLLPASTIPRLPVSPPPPRPLTDHYPEHESAESPPSARSRQSPVIQSPDTGTFSTRRYQQMPLPSSPLTGARPSSYDNPPFGSPIGELHERSLHPQFNTSNAPRDPLVDADNATTFKPLYAPDHEARREAARRFHLHIRQQPRAARAGPDGKDRR